MRWPVQAVLEHTMSSSGWQNFWMNGTLCGEVAIDAGIVGGHNSLFKLS
ncbi:MAG: M55 family metallopeptidase [Victivallaceae bacterium]|nr:M55 family metallopeptidase [Victivallaceae bacterium]